MKEYYADTKTMMKATNIKGNPSIGTQLLPKYTHMLNFCSKMLFSKSKSQNKFHVKEVDIVYYLEKGTELDFAHLIFEFLSQVIKDEEIISNYRVPVSIFKKLKSKIDDKDLVWSNVSKASIFDKKNFGKI